MTDRIEAGLSADFFTTFTGEGRRTFFYTKIWDFFGIRSRAPRRIRIFSYWCTIHRNKREKTLVEVDFFSVIKK